MEDDLTNFDWKTMSIILSQIDVDDLFILLNGRQTKTIGIKTMALALLRVTYK